jgi:hypothetical protein
MRYTMVRTLQNYNPLVFSDTIKFGGPDTRKIKVASCVLFVNDDNDDSGGCGYDDDDYDNNNNNNTWNITNNTESIVV